MEKVVTFKRGCAVGGNANNGTNAGLAYVNSNNSVTNTNSNIGSRTCKKKYADVRPHHSVKQNNTITALVAEAKKTRKSKAK